MNCYKIKINGRYVAGLKETEKQGSFVGGWHNNTIRMVTEPIFGDKHNALIIEGRINLKSYMERVVLMIKDGFEINNLEFVKVICRRTRN